MNETKSLEERYHYYVFISITFCHFLVLLLQLISIVFNTMSKSGLARRVTKLK